MKLVSTQHSITRWYLLCGRRVRTIVRMFTPEERERLRADLVAAARADPAVTGAAVTGSAAVGREDRWSDVDLALCLAPGADRDPVVAGWTARMYREHGAVEHLDVMSGSTLFRVFLLASTLQVDLVFWSAEEFGATAPTFRLLFGTANDRPPSQPPRVATLVGTAWLYALHARSSIERGRGWQAEYMISGMRDQVIALACLRNALPAVQGRGVDDLPAGDVAALGGTLVRSLDGAELRRAFGATSAALLAEVGRVDADLARRLTAPLTELAGLAGVA